MTEVVDALLRVNLVAGLAILAVLILRIPARRWFGAEVAYRLWAAPPLAAFATVLPLRHARAPLPHPPSHVASAHLAPSLLLAWGIGIAVAVALMAWTQTAFQRRARRGLAGPAVVGVIVPRIVMPPDDGRYSPEERALIRAHERQHLERNDPRAAALIAALQCLFWFNPLVHIAAHAARLDQELACDAAVIRRRPQARALYARTLLKTQLAGAALPFGCYWPARARHPLEVRVELLGRAGVYGGLKGPLLVGAGLVVAAILAGAVQPPLPPSPPRGVLVRDTGGAGQMSVMLVTWRVPAASPR